MIKHSVHYWISAPALCSIPWGWWHLFKCQKRDKKSSSQIFAQIVAISIFMAKYFHKVCFFLSFFNSVFCIFSKPPRALNCANLAQKTTQSTWIYSSTCLEMNSYGFILSVGLSLSLPEYILLLQNSTCPQSNIFMCHKSHFARKCHWFTCGNIGFLD